MGTSSSPVDNSVRDLVESLENAKIEIIQLEKTLDGFREEYEELLERHEHVLTMFYLSDPQLFEEEKDEDIPDEAFNYGLPSVQVLPSVEVLPSVQVLPPIEGLAVPSIEDMLLTSLED